MRVVMRLGSIGLVMVSCSMDGIMGPGSASSSAPPPCPESAIAQLDVGRSLPDPIELAMGSASHVSLTFPNCFQAPSSLPATEVVWTVRDNSVADITSILATSEQTTWGRFVLPVAPGRTHLVASARGHSDSIAITVLDTAAMGPVIRLGGGGDASCAITDDQVAMCWGYVPLKPPSNSKLGHCMGTPCSPFPTPVMSGARSVHASWGNACAVDANGQAWCWGQTVPTPGRVAGDAVFTTLAIGTGHTCGLTVSAAAMCWGTGTDGQLGHGVRFSADAPVPVSGNHSWASLAAFGETSCGITQDGELRCWGLLGNQNVTVPGASICTSTYRDKNGAVSTTSRPCSDVPFRMPLTATDTTMKFAEVNGSCARTVAGGVLCHDPSRGRFVEKTGFGPFTTIAASTQHGCGIDAAGTAWCWGSNQSGQLGDGTTTHRDSPVRPNTPNKFTQVMAGSNHTCGLTTTKEVWCWGSNYGGQAGVSTILRPRTPMRVRGQR